MLGRTAVYTAWDTNGVMLYVGISKNVAQRLYGHRYKSKWWAIAIKIRITFFSSKKEALQEEQKLEAEFAPLFNCNPRSKYHGAIDDRVYAATSHHGTFMAIARHTKTTTQQVRDSLLRLQARGMVKIFLTRHKEEMAMRP